MKKIIRNVSQIVSPAAERYAVGEEMNTLTVLEDSAVVIENGLIADIVDESVAGSFSGDVIDGEGAVLLPVFTDPHTHIPFAGTRENEFNLRIQGKSYMEIAGMGGGINSTVKDTRSVSEDDLYQSSMKNLQLMIEHGVGTFEIKSGYGLDTATELKQLRVIKRMQENTLADIKATFLGAHEIPHEFRDNKDEFVRIIIEEMLPAVKEQGIAEYCDIFCEKGVFEIEDSRKIMQAAKDLGFKLRFHADEIVPLGGSELAGEMGAVSADHLVHISDQGIDKMIESESVFVMLPGTTFFLMSDQYAPAKKIIDKGGIVALSTDFNPGSSHTHSMPLIIALSCLKMGMTIEQGINAATINGAYSLGMSDVTGSIHKGKQADFVFLDAEDYRFLVYNFGVNRVKHVMKKGEFIYRK